MVEDQKEKAQLLLNVFIQTVIMTDIYYDKEMVK